MADTGDICNCQSNVTWPVGRTYLVFENVSQNPNATRRATPVASGATTILLELDMY